MTLRVGPSTIHRLVTAYIHARQVVIDAGFLSEIQWQHSRCIRSVNETEFLREFAWVVLAAGMKEQVIRSKFPQVCDSFLGFRSAEAIAHNSDRCRSKALAFFGHEGKINAIISASVRINEEGYEKIVSRIEASDIGYLQTFSYIGPATSCHLAKNLGLDVVKPDRHLLRLAAISNYDSPVLLCRDIADFVGERLSVVDLVLWRYANLTSSYSDEFASFLRLPVSPNNSATLVESASMR